MARPVTRARRRVRRAGGIARVRGAAAKYCKMRTLKLALEKLSPPIMVSEWVVRQWLDKYWGAATRTNNSGHLEMQFGGSIRGKLTVQVLDADGLRAWLAPPPGGRFPAANPPGPPRIVTIGPTGIPGGHFPLQPLAGPASLEHAPEQGVTTMSAASQDPAKAFDPTLPLDSKKAAARTEAPTSSTA